MGNNEPCGADPADVVVVVVVVESPSIMFWKSNPPVRMLSIITDVMTKATTIAAAMDHFWHDEYRDRGATGANGST